jgi:hypothetical protein
MTTRKTRTTTITRATLRPRRAVAAARTEPKPTTSSRLALSEHVRSALRCATSASFFGPAARRRAELAEPAPFICG